MGAQAAAEVVRKRYEADAHAWACEDTAALDVLRERLPDHLCGGIGTGHNGVSILEYRLPGGRRADISVRRSEPGDPSFAWTSWGFYPARAIAAITDPDSAAKAMLRR